MDSVVFLRLLGSKNERDVWAARQAFGQMGPAATELLANTAAREAARRQRRRPFAPVLWLAVPGGLVGSLCLLDANLAVLIVLGPCLGRPLWSVSKDLCAPSRLERECVYLLATGDNARAVGPLLDALGSGDADLRRLAENALPRLLPRVPPANAAHFTPGQWNRLRRLLRRSGDHGPWNRAADTDLVLAALEMLTRCAAASGAATVPMALEVAKLARFAKDGAVRAQAQQTLRVIEKCLPPATAAARAAQQQHGPP
jgi:hypothetical protein